MTDLKILSKWKGKRKLPIADACCEIIIIIRAEEREMVMVIVII